MAVIRLLVCEHVLAETEILIGESGAEDVQVMSYEAECTQPRMEWGRIKEMVDGFGDPVLLVGAECLKAAGPPPRQCRKCMTLLADQCFDLFGGPSIIEKCISNGAYIILPGWLRSWRRHMKQWGLDRRLAGDFFGESVQSIVLLQTMAYEGMENDLEEFAEFVALPHSIVDVGLDRYRDLLNAALREARLNGQLVDARGRLTAAEMAQADLAMAMEALRSISQLSDEDAIVQAVLQMHLVLFSPGDLRYRSVQDGALGRSYTPLSPADMRSDEGPSVRPTGDGKGFTVVIGNRKEVLGILEARDLAFPNHLDQYMALARDISSVYGLSIAKARDLDKVAIANRRVEEVLRQGAETLRLIVDSAPFPLLITDKDGNYIIDANQRAVDAFGLDLAEGPSLIDIFIDRRTPQMVTDAMAIHGSVDDMEVSVRSEGGDHLWAILSVRTMSYQGEERLLLATYDITERRNMERALQQANTKLGMLNSITRHDIINQMLVLTGFLELSRLREKDPKIMKYLARMGEASDNVQKQVAFTREYQDIGVKAPTWASPGRQTTNAFEMLHPDEVELEDNTKGIEVLADPLAEKVPYNLIDNSMRHGGHVTRIKIGAEQRGDAMSIVYEDDGVGISEEDKKRLFEKGFGKNTGFGLFLCREILAITGTIITETGKEGEGVRFEMLVPAGAWRWRN